MSNATVTNALLTLVLLGLGWLLKIVAGIARRQDEQGEAITTLRVTLIGASGSNGLNSDVKTLLRWQPRAAARLTRLETHADLPPLGDVT